MKKGPTKKERREHQVLMGLVELYLKLGKPIGSHTLHEQGFETISSATIRNYFSELEKEGYLHQAHASGGRIPTEAAFRLYAEESRARPELENHHEQLIRPLSGIEARNLTAFLHTSLELLSSATGYAAFLSSVRFDHDFLLEVKLTAIDATRLLCVLITDFGQIFTEIMAIDKRLSLLTLKKIEGYLRWRLKGQKTAPPTLNDEEERLAQTLYNEIMIRYIVRYSNFSDEEIHRTGFSRLLAYPEFNDPVALTGGLALFENLSHMRALLSECVRKRELCLWMGSELATYTPTLTDCCVIARPYLINQTVCGAVGILGPLRMPYRSLFGALQLFTESMSLALTKSFYKFKLTFREPRMTAPYLEHEERALVNQTAFKLIEKKGLPHE